MKHLDKPNYNVKKIVEDCAESFRDEDKKNRFIRNAEYIATKSNEYDLFASRNDLYLMSQEASVKGEITRDEMIKLYNDKFVKNQGVRKKYYDKIINSVPLGRCPICGIGIVSTLDHYLAKTLYPVFSVTPFNLIPICKDCNQEKHTLLMNSKDNLLFHPYYEDVDKVIWLKAKLHNENDGIVAIYSINEELNSVNVELYKRLVNSLNAYELAGKYSVQASSEIADRMDFWRDQLNELGEEKFTQTLRALLNSEEKRQRNTWHTALLRALISDINIINSSVM